MVLKPKIHRNNKKIILMTQSQIKNLRKEITQAPSVQRVPPEKWAKHKEYEKLNQINLSIPLLQIKQQQL